jgi:hypothetical protein
MIGDNTFVDSCLQHNGSLYAKTENIEGLIVEVCQLEETQACACKYFQYVRANGHPPVRLCLYEVCTYEHGGHDIFQSVHVGDDFTMKQHE